MAIWDEVATALKRNFEGTRYEKNSLGLVKVIEKLRSSEEFSQVQPGISLVNLTLSILGMNTQIYIWCENPDDEYMVYLYDGNSYDKSITTLDNITSVITTYISKIKRM